MKKIAIFAIFLIATIMTFGQLVPDQQFLAPARVKSLTTKFTRLIPAHTIVYVDVTPYVLDSTGYVGKTLAHMILTGAAVLQSGAVAASFVAADSNYLHTTGTGAGYGNYTWYGTNTFRGALWDSLRPAATNTGYVGTPTHQWGSGYFHYITGDWGAFTKATGTYSKFGTDSATTFVGALTGHASLDWSKPDTGINSKLAAYYTTMAAIGLKANTANPTFTTGATAPIFTATSTDTSSATAAVGTIFMHISGGDTSMWVLIRKTGTIHARWKKLSN
jgi:hypothetical protein